MSSSQASQFSQSVVGAIVEIQSSHSTRQRMPHLIGKLGSIKVIPCHPSTWYVVEVPKLGVVRLQPTGFNVVSIANLTKESKYYTRVMDFMKSKAKYENDLANGNIDDTNEPIDEGETENSQQSVNLLSKGTRVQILPSAAVMQRLPFLVGKKGVVKETPLNHSHWYKIEIEDGSMVNLRPSALQILNDNDIDAIKTESGKGSSRENIPESKLKSVASNDSIVSSRSGQKMKRKLLSDTDPETWVGRRVRIIKEKLVGSIGVVLRSGNGWVQVETDSIDGEIAKRAYELEILMDDASMDDLASLTASSMRDEKKPKKGPYVKKHKLKGGFIGSYARSVSSNLESLARASSDTANGLDDSGTPTPLLTRSRAGSVDIFTKQDPKISFALRELKRQLTQKYVDRHQEKIATRPDLMYWLHHLKAGMVDSEYDRQVAKEFEDTYCKTCFTEKWPNSVFCWNKMCRLSPIYWEKLDPNEKPKDSDLCPENSLLRSSNTPSLNIVSDFLISVPSRLIGTNRENESVEFSKGTEQEESTQIDEHRTQIDEHRTSKKTKLVENSNEHNSKRSRLR